MNTVSNNSSGSTIDWRDEVSQYWVAPDSEQLQSAQQDGATAILDFACDFQPTLIESDRELAARVIGRISDIQVRDFALGCYNEQTFAKHFQMWSALIELAPEGFIAPIATVLAAMAYESGDEVLAYTSLERAFADDPTYALAGLLRRVFTAGWPAASFVQMRAELHPKVVSTIFG